MRHLAHPAPLARTALGLVLLAIPRGVLRTIGARDDSRAAWTARILGVRHLVEVAILTVWRTRRVAEAGAAVDAIHALTALGLAAADRGRRRGALINAATASAFSLAGAAHARSDRLSDDVRVYPGPPDGYPQGVDGTAT